AVASVGGGHTRGWDGWRAGGGSVRGREVDTEARVAHDREGATPGQQGERSNVTATSTLSGFTGADDAVLDNPSWSALTGAQAHLAEGDDLARRFPADVSPITGVRSWDEPGVWDSIATLVGPGGRFSAPPAGVELPPGWTLDFRVDGVQLVETGRLDARPDPEAVVLGADDVPDMLALVERSRPGPFEARTYLLGRYVGF